jgi:ABC-2 type transport system permease protein
MKNVWTIARRELRGYFDSPVAYIVIVAFLLIAGWMYFSAFFLIDRADMRVFFSPSPFSPSMLLVLIAPAVTMRLIAEERKSGTIELLTTLPVTDSEVIMGKFLGAVGLLMAGILSTLVYAIVVSFIGRLDWGPVVCGYLGLSLFAMSLLAVGVCASTFTSNQIIAFIFGCIISAALYYIYWLQFFMPELLAPLFEFLSVSYHLDNMARGVIDSRDVLYYLTLTGGALFIAVQGLKRQHA